jgi:hypothetical protein
MPSPCARLPCLGNGGLIDDLKSAGVVRAAAVEAAMRATDRRNYIHPVGESGDDDLRRKNAQWLQEAYVPLLKARRPNPAGIGRWWASRAVSESSAPSPTETPLNP